VWLGWLERVARGECRGIETPIGYIPTYADLKALFAEMDKPYPKELYDKQFALYVDNILARIELQEAAYREEENVPDKLFEIYAEQRAGLETLKARYGAVVSVEQLTMETSGEV
jgi:phosphoenolpyruvate carboxykinase (GTP)